MVTPYAFKYSWFIQNGYMPHVWQTLFHTNSYEGKLCRYRHLVAGRRGGKTLSAAWEVLYYVQHPEEWWKDFRNLEKDEPLTVWVLAKDYPTGKAALDTFREVCVKSGLVHSKDYKEHRGNKWFEFSNGSFVHFRSAEDPQSLRGAGLNLLWMDETAFIPSDEAYMVARPALSDKMGAVIGTTTPAGKNWLYDEFWGKEALKDPTIGRVEYTSIHNPYFPAEEWQEVKKRYHPMLFKQEYMAAFDSMAGKALSGDWLHYYEWDNLPRIEKDGVDLLNLDVYVGIDPAAGQTEKADRFGLAVIGVSKDYLNVYLLETWAGRIPFPEQMELIMKYHTKWKPHYIGVESNAYQKVLVQQSLRLPTLPPIMDIQARGRKEERILSMSPLFKIGRVLIRNDQLDFINEWVDYDPDLSHPRDDLLDAVEIALRAAGAVLPEDVEESSVLPPIHSLDEEILQDWPKAPSDVENTYMDPFLGSDW